MKVRCLPLFMGLCFHSASAAPGNSPNGDSNKPGMSNGASDQSSQCGNGKVNVCHYSNDPSYQTICVSENGAETGHLDNHKMDYLGECSETVETFRDRTFIPGLTHDTETKTFETDNGKTYRMDSESIIAENGVVALVQAMGMIRSLTCIPADSDGGSSTVRVEFSVDNVPSPTAPYLFPSGAIVAVPGAEFGSCPLFPSSSDPDEDGSTPIDGFLLVEAAAGNNGVFDVTGKPQSFSSLFEVLKMDYRQTGNSRHLYEAEDHWHNTIDGRDFANNPIPVKLETEGDNVGDGAEFNDLSVNLVKGGFEQFLGSGKLNSYTISGNLRVDAVIDLKQTLTLYHQRNLAERYIEKQLTSIFIYGVPVNGKLNKILGNSAQVGLYLDILLFIDFKAELTSEFEVTVDSTFRTGRQEVSFEYSRNLDVDPFDGLDLFEFDFNEIANEEPSFAINDVSTGQTHELTVTTTVGLKPQASLEISGFGSIDTGLQAGLKNIATFRTEPYEPIQDANHLLYGCDSCHLLESDLNAVFGKPYIDFNYFLQNKKKKESFVFGSAKVEVTLATLCALDTTSCGGGCCNDPEASCCDDVCCVGDCCDGVCCAGGDSCCGNTCCGATICLDGVCCGETGCCHDDDCPLDPLVTPRQQRCDITTNTCVCEVGVSGIQCCEDDDCTDESAPTCSNLGQCYCEGDTCCGEGSECCTDSDCSDDRYYCSSSNTCEPLECDPDLAAFQCCQDSDCGRSDYICENFECKLSECDTSIVECCEDSDCEEGLVCSANVCLQSGNPRFTLIWIGDDDLDLHVRTPSGAEIWYSNVYDSTSEGRLDHDDIPPEGDDSLHAENIFFPEDGSSPSGTYEYWVFNYNQQGTVDDWTLELYLGDTLLRRESGTAFDREESEKFQYVK